MNPAASAPPAGWAPSGCWRCSTKITNGNGTMEDLDKLEELCYYIKENSLCGLGQTAPNPVLSTLQYFRDEYVAHVVDKNCPAGVCKALLQLRDRSQTSAKAVPCAPGSARSARSPATVKNPHVHRYRPSASSAAPAWKNAASAQL